MNAFGTCASALSDWTRRTIAAAKKCYSPLPTDGAVPRRVKDANQAPATGGVDSRRHRVDALYAFGVLAAIAGFVLVGNDINALRNRATVPTTSSRGASTLPQRPDPGTPLEPLAPVLRKPSPFPAPTDPKAWAEAIATCARPGPRVKSFVESFDGTPSQRIAQIYVRIAQHWHYAPDTDHDRLIPAETLLEPGMLRGDCKAVAILLAAASAELGIANRMVATRGLTTAAGHVQTQLLLCRPGEDPRPIVDTMAAVWNQLGQTTNDGKAEFPLVLTAEGWYLALDGGQPPKRVEGLGPVEVIVSSSGRTDR